jgi:uncharacterized membrane protein
MNAGPSFSRKLLGLLFAVAGVLHFLAPGGYERIMPPYLPLHRELVYLSGAAEILGGLGLLPKRTRRAAGIGLVLLLIAVWPANVQMLIDARASQEPGGGWRYCGPASRCRSCSSRGSGVPSVLAPDRGS